MGGKIGRKRDQKSSRVRAAGIADGRDNDAPNWLLYSRPYSDKQQLLRDHGAYCRGSRYVGRDLFSREKKDEAARSPSGTSEQPVRFSLVIVSDLPARQSRSILHLVISFFRRLRRIMAMLYLRSIRTRNLGWSPPLRACHPQGRLAYRPLANGSLYSILYLRATAVHSPYTPRQFCRPLLRQQPLYLCLPLSCPQLRWISSTSTHLDCTSRTTPSARRADPSLHQDTTRQKVQLWLYSFLTLYCSSFRRESQAGQMETIIR